MAAQDRPEPAGFGRCGSCAYLQSGTPRICFGCARASMEALTSERCRVCDLPNGSEESKCANVICGFDMRYFDWNYAAAMRSGVLERAINLYKYEDRKGWARIFARVLVGFLREQEKTFRDFDLITASPSFVADDGSSRSWDHTGAVIRIADDLSEGEWPFDTNDPPVIIKTAPTERMTGKTWKQRWEIAKGPLTDALVVPDAMRTRGQQILVYDDVFTGGHTLWAIARRLIRSGGAVRVCGVTLARQHWTRRPT